MIALVGSGVAALVIFDPFKWFAAENRVPAAVTKMFSSNAPLNIHADGTITVALESGDSNSASDITEIDIDFDGTINAPNFANTATANVTAVMADDSEVKFKVDEIHTKDDELFLKAGENLQKLFKTDSVYAKVLGKVGENWTLVTSENYGYIGNLIGLDSTMQCYIGSAANWGDLFDANTVGELLTASTENLNVAKKNDELYRVYVKMDKLATATGCNKTNVTPTIYVEINESYYITRVYFKMTNSDGKMSITADLALTYPTTFEINEPREYVDFTTALKEATKPETETPAEDEQQG